METKLPAGGPFTLEQIYAEVNKWADDIKQTAELYDGPEDNLVFFLVEWKWREGFSHRWITVYQHDHYGWWYKFMLWDNTGSTHDIEVHLKKTYLDTPNRTVAASSSSSACSQVIPGSKRDPNRENKPRTDYVSPTHLDFNKC